MRSQTTTPQTLTNGEQRTREIEQVLRRADERTQRLGAATVDGGWMDGWMAPCAKQMSNFLRSLFVMIRIGMLVTWTFKKTISYY